jgi:hypothetical protein
MASSDITDGKHPSMPVPPQPNASLDAETRQAHYVFAHYALRSVALNDPVFYLGVLASPAGSQFLDDLLTTVSEHARPDDPPPDFSAADCRIHTVRAGVYPCAVVEMPPPRAMTEAYFTAAVLLLDPAQEQADLTNAAVRYFTLEQGFDLEGHSRTVLCEWNKDGTHVNFGEGPSPTVERFVSALSRRLLPAE